MIETTYKAKRLDNGAWVEGHCVKTDKHAFIFYYIPEHCNVGHITIDPATLRRIDTLEYGTRLVENDVYKNNLNNLIYVLKYGEFQDYYTVRYHIGWYLKSKEGCEVLDLGDLDCHKQIGNALDNPELLEG